MKAYRFLDWLQPPELSDVPVPEPGPGEVLIRVGGAGACHSDLHIFEYPPGKRPWVPPFTIGHENAGWVEELGTGVTGVSVGDAVAVYGPWGCGRCRACRESKENYCELMATQNALGGGLGRDGGMAEYMLVPSARLLVPLGDLHPSEAAPLTDAALTPYHAIKRSLHRLHPGTTAVVIGVGGLGHMAVQILRALSGAQIVAVDLDPAKLALAAESGADSTVTSGQSAADEVRELTRGLGAELVLDFVGATSTIALAGACVRAEGDVTIVGAAGGEITWRFGALPPEVSLSNTFWGSGTDLIDVLELARQGRIRAHIERFPLDRVDEAYDRLRAGTIQGRAVIVPNAA
jgi:propanol-preferring alcohol dehydrogenase